MPKKKPFGGARIPSCHSTYALASPFWSSFFMGWDASESGASQLHEMMSCSGGGFPDWEVVEICHMLLRSVPGIGGMM